MTTPNLGRLQRVDLRAVWLSESGDFTPWLSRADNLALLAETVGLELELESTEKHVGPFRADILCKETLTDNWVLIENQLERTDHSHLGQLLTYAAGLSTVTIVWVTERFTDEHRAALDWLNEVTQEGINFFGLEVELWRIGDSNVAPKFNIISQPNDWTKQTAVAREVAAAVSETGQLKLEFWTGFSRYLEDQHSHFTPKKPSTDNWTNFGVGRTNFVLTAVINARDGRLSVNINISGPYVEQFFYLLRQQKETIEREIGETLDWRDVPGNRQRYIHLFRNNIDATNRQYWPEYFEWLRIKLEAFYRAFAPRVKALNAADYVPPLITEATNSEPL